jgi:NAD(P)-dependent dehydrogenase (short-subunit alcohol dehydrogenase family)
MYVSAQHEGTRRHGAGHSLTFFWTVMEQSLSHGSAYDALLKSQPISRYGSADEVAQVCVFLASTRASFVTGEEIVVDGGLLHSI